MTQEQTLNYVNVTLAFLNRTSLQGNEAETIVEVKRWLGSLIPRQQLSLVQSPVVEESQVG